MFSFCVGTFFAGMVGMFLGFKFLSVWVGAVLFSRQNGFVRVVSVKCIWSFMSLILAQNEC